MADTPSAEPFFQLPDAFPQDDQDQHAEYPSPSPSSLPPITVSCGSCERIVGDSSLFICAIRHVGGITMESMTSVTLGEVRATEADGAFDQLW